MKCARCGTEIDEEDTYELGKEKVCEDCFLDTQMPQHPCDPIAQSAADRLSEIFGEIKPDELLEEQRRVYEFIKEKGKVTPAEILNRFGMREGDLRQIFIVLRRLRLAKGRNIGGKIYYVPWDYQE
ncbi:MAG: hypothetical protein ACXQT5_04895 [Candidatus Syntropharchaeia archaeon]